MIHATHATGNILATTVVKRGDLAAARAASAYISADRYETQRIEHGYMEPEASIAYPADGWRRRCSRRARASTRIACSSPSCWAWTRRRCG